MNKLTFAVSVLVTVLSFSTFAQADEICQKATNVADVIADNWVGSCQSVNRTNYNDPYNPLPYPAKYYTFTLDREADIKISLNTFSFNTLIYLLDGESKNGTVLKQVGGKTLESYLPAGTYTLEVTSTYLTTFSITFEYNDLGNTACVQNITAGVSISDGWIPSCESNNRDIIDPYSPYPDLGFRAKYFTFSLAEDSDINIKVTSAENSYIYLLSGIGEFSVPLLEFNSNDVLTPLPAGDYTIELTTYDRYAPGNFVIQYDVLDNDFLCTQELVFDEAINSNWSNTCLIQTWDNSNTDPYAGVNPERAMYYTFSLQQSTDFRFRIYSSNPKLVLNLYRGSDFTDLVESNLEDNYWYRSTESVIEATLAPDVYTLEVTSYDQLAVGNYSFVASILGVSVCMESISLVRYYRGLLSEGCLSQFREGVNNDPYAPQPGDYYAKRFEFELTEPQAIKFNGALGASSVSLYLSEKNESGGLTLLEESEFNYWSSSRNESISRVLDVGTYVAEITTTKPFQTSSYTISVSPVSNGACEIFLKMDESLTGSSLNRNCPSNFKEGYRNPDPYGSPSEFVFNSKTISFKVETAGDITFDISAFGFIPHLYLVSGINREGELLLDERMVGSSAKVTNYLEAGFYTLEITSTEASQYGTLSISISDSNKAPETEPPVIEEPLSICEYDLAQVSQQTILGEWSDSCIPRNSVFYNFELEKIERLDIFFKSNVNSIIIIERLVDESWSRVWRNISNDDGVIRLTGLFDAGQHRIRVYKRPSNEEFNTFKLTVKGNLGKDSDNDGVGDDIDLFPNDDSLIGDVDENGIDDIYDNDFDNDGVLNANDVFPHDPDEAEDDDNDGIGNNADDTPLPVGGVVQLEQSKYKIDENTNQLVISIVRSDVDISAHGPSRYVWLRTNDGSAKSNRDFSPIRELLVFEDGDESKEIMIDIINNTLFEGNKSFEIELLFPLGMKMGENKRASIRIVEDEPLPDSGLIKWKSIEEKINESNEVYSFEIIREGDLYGEVTIYYATQDGTALASRDYHAQAGSVIFLEGESIKLVTVTLMDNDEPGFNKYFSIDITHADDSVHVVNPRKTILINDTDNDSNFSLVSFKEKELQINEYHGYIGIEVVRGGNLNILSTMEWRIKTDNAVAGVDYINNSGILQFKEGEKSKLLSIRLLGDFKPDGVKKLSVELFNASERTAIVDNSIELIITDEKLMNYGGLGFSSDEYRISEDEGIYEIAVLRSFLRFRNSTVDYEVMPKSAMANQDFVVSKGTLHFAGSYPSGGASLLGNGDIGQSIQVEIIDDDAYEGLEYFEVELKNGQSENSSGGYNLDDTLLGENRIIKVYIVDNDEPPASGVLRFSGNSYRFLESENKALITVQRINVKPEGMGEISVDYSTSEDTALANQHYNTAAGTLNFSEDEFVKAIEIDLIDNILDEVNKSFGVTLSNPIGTIINNPRRTIVEIEDDDVTLFGVISLENISYEVNRTDGVVEITLNRTEGTEGEISVNYRINTLDGETAQFLNATGTVIFADGEDTKTIEIVFDDEAYGEGEFQIVLSDGGGTQFKGETTITVKIIDDVVEADEEVSDKKKSTLFGSLSLWLLLVTGVFLLLLSPRRKQKA